MFVATGRGSFTYLNSKSWRLYRHGPPHILTARLFTSGLESAPWNTHHLHGLSQSIWYIFHRQHRAQIPHSGSHTALHSGSYSAHNSWGGCRTHIAPMLQQAVTQWTSPCSAGVINDFLWLPSNSPSIVSPLFLIEESQLSLSYLCPPFW